MLRHQEHYYGGAAWANEIAKRGYVVLVHDAFTFGSRRVMLADVPSTIKGDLTEQQVGRQSRAPDGEEPVFGGGTTWPSVFTSCSAFICSGARPDPTTSALRRTALADWECWWP